MADDTKILKQAATAIVRPVTAPFMYKQSATAIIKPLTAAELYKQSFTVILMPYIPTPRRKRLVSVRISSEKLL